MQILSVDNLTVDFGFNKLFDNLSFSLNEGESISIVGPNGCGKSTLLKIIAGIIKPDKGQVSIKKDARLAYLDQTGASIDDNRCVYEILKESFSDLNELEKSIKKLEDKMNKNTDNQKIINKYCSLIDRYSNLGGYEIDANINTIIAGLKLDSTILDKSFNPLSGGEKTLVQLAKVLIVKPDLLLLDEPTNHLDIERIRWLENYIKNFKGAAVIVSHDRYFLDKMCNKILDLESAEGKIYSTNYTGFLEEKERLFEKQMTNYKEEQLLIKGLETKMKWFAERGMATNSSTLTARARALETRINRIKSNAIIRPVKRNKANINFLKDNKTINRIISLRNFIVNLPNGKDLIQNITLDVFAGEHIALIGENGCGKSTLVKSIIGINNLNYAGIINIGPSVRIGYIPQIISFKDDKQSLLDYFRLSTGLSEQMARQILVGFQFYNDDIKKRVGSLSGGERMKVKLAELLQNKVNTLILDEPTNHIDIDTKESFENALKNFSGTLLFVSHDRYFINKFADKIFELNNGNINIYYGNYDDYVNKKI